MNLAYRLFLKDQRVLRWWLVAWFVLQVAYVIVNYLVWRSNWAHSKAQVVSMVLFILGILLLVQLVQQEPVHQGVDFWKTRPMRPPHLLLGKAVFIIVYLILLPWLAHTVLLCLTGYLGYLRFAWAEWASTHLLIGTVMMALASSSHSRHLVGLGLGGLILAALLHILVDGLKRYFHWTPEIAPWWDYPSVPVLGMLLVGVAACAVVLNQYLTGRRGRSLAIMAIGIVAAKSLNLLPLVPHAPVYTVAYPPTNERLDRMAEVIAPELSRICPLGPETGTWSEYNNRRLAPIERAMPTMPHSVNTRYSRAMIGDREVRSDQFSQNQPELRLRSDQGIFQRAVGLTEPPAPLLYRTWPESTLFEFDENHLARLGTNPGLMKGELILTEHTTTLLMSLPLESGATYRNGPFTLTITKVDLTASHYQIRLVQDTPRRLVTRPWPGLPQDGMSSNNLRLFHQPTKTFIRFGGSAGRGGTTAWRKRSEQDLSLPSGYGRYASLSHSLLKENLDPTEWRLVGVAPTLVASKQVPFEVPDSAIPQDIDRGWPNPVTPAASRGLALTSAR